MTERLTGFGGEGRPLWPKDFDDFPAWGERMMSERARTRRLTNPACVGPVAYRDTSFVEADIANLRQATAGRDVADVFMSAASPGVIALFHSNEHYGSDEEYIAALADAMKTEYDAIHAAGLVLQLDCPDLAMGWNVAGIGGTPEGFLAEVTARVAAINHATRDIPPEAMRLHLCWGNDQLRGASRAGGAADRALRAAGRPGERPGQQRLRLRHVRHLHRGRPAGHVGQAGGDGRRGPAGEPGALGLTGRPPPGPGRDLGPRKQASPPACRDDGDRQAGTVR